MRRFSLEGESLQLPTALRALRHQDYRLLWSGQVISQVGSWMQIIGHNWLILQLTDSPLKISLISVLQFACCCSRSSPEPL
jgi:hypothetical protein